MPSGEVKARALRPYERTYVRTYVRSDYPAKRGCICISQVVSQAAWQLHDPPCPRLPPKQPREPGERGPDGGRGNARRLETPTRRDLRIYSSSSRASRRRKLLALAREGEEDRAAEREREREVDRARDI